MAPGAIAAFKGGGIRMISQEIDRIPLDKGGLFFCAEVIECSLPVHRRPQDSGSASSSQQ